MSGSSMMRDASGAESGLSEPRQLGQYEIVRMLGRGGMGVVYEAIHSHLRRNVALKVISDHRLHDSKVVQRFYREMATIGTLEHPNIVRAHDAGEIDGTLFLSMELVNGCNVELIAKTLGPLDVAESCEIVRQAALALAYAHRNDVIHRDIKPSNLLLNSDGVVKVADLGLARLFGQSTQEDITGKDCVVGTPDYMSPEQARGEPSLDERTDLYSLGCTLYRLLAGTVPFDGPRYLSGLQKVLGHVNDDPSPISEIREGLPAELSTIVGRMMAKSPDERFSSAEELVRALEQPAANADLAALVLRARDKRPVSAESPATFHSTATDLQYTRGQPNPLPSTQPMRHRWRLTAGLAVGCLLLLSVYFGGSWWTHTGEVAPAPVAAGVTGSPPASPAAPSGEEPDAGAPQNRNIFRDGETKRLIWHELLRAEPTPLKWPRDAGLSSWSHQAKLKQLSVNCRSAGLLAMGSVEAESWTLQVDVFQSSWTGGAGLFWGYRTVDTENGPHVVYQKLVLQQVRGQQPIPTYAICLSRVTSAFNVSSDATADVVDLATENIQLANNKPQMLEITIRRGQLHRVRWSGQTLKDLSRKTINPRLNVEDHQGWFGTYNAASNAVFRNARIMLD